MLLRVSTLCLTLLAGSSAAFAATPMLVRDIEQRSGEGHIFIEQIVSVGERAVFFLQSDDRLNAARLQELWTTDGTASGTERLRSFPTELVSLGGNGRIAFFAFTTSIGGGTTDTWQLWRTDGTAAGTFSLSLTLGPPSPQVSSTLYQDRLVFNGCTLQGGCELWASDGTTAGTRQLRDITPGPASSGPHGFAVAGGTLYFFVDDPTGPALWASDGTSAGTQRVATLPPFSRAHDITAAGDRIFFLDGERDSNPLQTLLWTSDGSAAGTRTVPPFDHARRKGPAIDSFLGWLGDSFFFTTFDTPTGQQLWKTDGTPAGTLRLTSFPRLGGFFSSAGAALGGRFVFPGTGGHLWTTAGTRASTQRLAGCPGGCSLVVAGAEWLVHGGKLFFSGITRSAGEELWVTDGTGAGTHSLGGSSPLSFSVLLGRVFFVTRTGLWTTDGTPGGTVLLSGAGFAGPPAATGSRAVFATFSSDSNLSLGVTDGTPPGTEILDVRFAHGAGSDPSSLLPFGDEVRFLNCGSFPPQLWTSDGTAGGTFPVSDVAASCASLVKLGDAAYFLGGDITVSPPVLDLWRSDGTPGGTFPITRFGPDRTARRLATAGDRLVLFMTQAAAGGKDELWTSDGTELGTVKVTDLPDHHPTPLATPPGGPPGEIFFKAVDAGGYIIFWHSDGTAAGTRRLVKFFSPAEFSGFTRFNGALYFAASQGGLWRTDGTPAGTRQILQDAVTELVPFAGSLFLFDQSRGNLLRSDGSEAGTNRIMDLSDGQFLNQVDPQLTVAGGALYFVAFDAGHGTELWRTDGTRDGTRRVADVVPGTGSSFPAQLTAAGGLLYFTANDGEHGRELWVTDGTGPGTRMVADIASGSPSSSPVQLTVAGDHLFFSADDGFTGRELWLLPLGPDN